jgi:hypothetical protein
LHIPASTRRASLHLRFPLTQRDLTRDTIACVLNGGAVNGVACFCVHPTKGLVPDGVGLREFGYSSTTPPQLGGKKGSGSDIQFNGDSSKLITTFKGVSKPSALGHISVFDVDNSGNVAKHFTDNQVSPLNAIFGFALNGNDLSEFYVTEAAFGGALISLDSTTNKVSALATVNDSSLVASCWAVWASATDTYYDIFAGSPSIVEVDSAGKMDGTIDFNKKLGGGVDSVVYRTTLYTMTAINAIVAIDLTSGKHLQTYKYANADNRPYWTGLAM